MLRDHVVVDVRRVDLAHANVIGRETDFIIGGLQDLVIQLMFLVNLTNDLFNDVKPSFIAVIVFCR